MSFSRSARNNSAMNAQEQQEMWQIEVGGQVYEASFVEMTEWIAEGSLQPEDKVRKGNLRWIEARKVPTLTTFFNAKQKGLPPPVVVTTSAPAARHDPAGSAAENVVSNTASSTVVQPSAPVTQSFVNSSPQSANVCQRHPELASVFVCNDCGNGFCKGCPSAYGGSVRICPSCGGMCAKLDEVKKSNDAAVQHRIALEKGFGFADFSVALGYPFKFGTSLVFGALMFMFFSLGQSASALGGIFMIVAAIFCFMLANMLTFGILANTVDNFSQGRIGLDFMPSFEDFSIWDDVLHPFFLSIGAYVASFGAFIVVLLVGLYFVISAMTAQMNAQQKQLENLPGTPYYSARDTFEQSKDVNAVVDTVRQQNEERLKRQIDTSRQNEESLKRQEAIASGNVSAGEDIESGNVPTDPVESTTADSSTPPVVDDTEVMVKEADELLNRTRKAQLESTFGKTPETQQAEYAQMVKGFLTLAAPFVILAAITLIWGLFYFPAACAVAGYTRSFFATINPLVGLDTIRRLGLDYVKILFMGFLLLAASGLVGAVLGMIFVPFDMPGFGNLPAKAIGSLFAFYLWIVFSCVLGFAIYKASDRLKLYK